MNPYSALRKLFPDAPLLIGRVLTHTSAGLSLIELPQGGQILARGTQVPTGQMAYIKAGQVQGQAQNIIPVEVTV